MSLSYRRVSIFLTKKQARVLKKEPKRLWEQLLELKREQLKQQRRVSLIKRETYQRDLNRILSRESDFELEHDDLRMLSPLRLPSRKPRFVPKSRRTRPGHKKPNLYVDPKILRRYQKNEHQREVSERDQANFKLVGQNPSGYTNYTPNVSVVINEQSGEINKQLGQGQQDRLERHHRITEYVVETQQVTVQQRQQQQQSTQLQNRQQKAEHEEQLEHQRHVQRQFEHQYKMAQQEVRELRFQRQLEDEMAMYQRPTAAPAA